MNNNTFYIGGTAVPSTYNVMRLRVLNAAKTEVGRYYMNAFPTNAASSGVKYSFKMLSKVSEGG